MHLLFTSVCLLAFTACSVSAQSRTELYERDVARRVAARQGDRLRARAQVSPMPAPVPPEGSQILAIQDSDYYTCKSPAPDSGFILSGRGVSQNMFGPEYLNCYYANPTASVSIYCVYNPDGTFRTTSSSANGCPEGDLAPAEPYSRTCFSVCSGPPTFRTGIFSDYRFGRGNVLSCNPVQNRPDGSSRSCSFDANTGARLAGSTNADDIAVCDQYTAPRGNCIDA